MPTSHPISASVKEALDDAIHACDTEAIADAFVEMYVLAHVGMFNQPYAVGVDGVAVKILKRQTGQ